MALITDIADAVVTELASGGEGFSESFTPERRVLPHYELADLKDLRVTVVPRGVEITGASRTLSQHDVQIDIGIQKKLLAGAEAGTDVDTQVAELLSLVEEIAEFLQRRPLAAMPQAVWVTTSNEPIYAPDHLAETRLFTSVLTVTYRLLK